MCSYCNGTGFMPGEKRYSDLCGKVLEYDTVRPCICQRQPQKEPESPKAIKIDDKKKHEWID